MVEGKYALIIACNRYDDGTLGKLKAPAQDAEELARVLAKPEVGGYDVTRCINKYSHETYLDIESFLDDRNRDDTILLYFSCHGIKDKGTRLYYATKNTNPKYLNATAISARSVNELMQACRAETQILLLDCCYSAAFLKGSIKGDSEIHTQDIFGTGKVIMTASDAMQYSFEGDIIDGKGIGSYFTRALVSGLETGQADNPPDGNVSYKELFDYVSKRVKENKPEQTPNLFAEKVDGDVIIAANPRYKNIVPPITIKEHDATNQQQKDVQDKQKSIIENLISDAHSRLDKKEYLSAQRLFDSVLVMQPDNVESLYGKGLALHKQKQYHEAKQCFEDVLRKNDKYIEEAGLFVDFINRLEADREKQEIKIKKTKTKRQDSKPKSKQEIQDVKKLYDEGWALLDQQKYQEAISAFDKAIELNPNDANAWYNKGYALGNLAKYEEAIIAFDKAIEIKPDDANAWNNKGYALFNLGKYEEAIECYDKALEIEPKNIVALNNLEILGKKKDDSRQQIERSAPRYDERVPGADPRNPYNDRTLPYYNPNLDKRNDSMQSIQTPGQPYHYAPVTRVDSTIPYPNDATAWNNKGMSLDNLGKHKEAIACYDKALEINPDDATAVTAWLGKGSALYSLDKYKEAIECYDKALEINLDYDQAKYMIWLGKGAAFNELGKYKEAIECYDKALEINPDDATAWHSKSIALGKLGRYEEAIKCYMKARELGHKD
jgi:tetratricopeptide (TPR) repeat protein